MRMQEARSHGSALRAFRRLAVAVSRAVQWLYPQRSRQASSRSVIASVVPTIRFGPTDAAQSVAGICISAGLLPGLEWTLFGEALDRFDLCVVLGDALGSQMWIVEARSHDDSDTLDCSGFHLVDAVSLRTTIAC
jgi:hypothetical protein